MVIGWWLSLTLTELLMLLPALWLPALESADVTGLITAVRGFSASQGTLIFSFEESCS